MTGWEQNVDPAFAYPARVWRDTWTLPLAFSPVEKCRSTSATRTSFVRATAAKRGRSSAPISRARTKERPRISMRRRSPTTTALSRHGVVYAIAPSPLCAGHLWAGTDDGNIWVTRDDSRRWQNVTPPQLTPWSKVGIIEASHFDAATAYAAVDRHRLDDYRPYIYRTTDGGTTWTRSPTESPTVRSSTPCAKIRKAAACSTPVPSAASTFVRRRRNWQPLQLNFPLRRSATSPCTATISWSRRTAARFG